VTLFEALAEGRTGAVAVTLANRPAGLMIQTFRDGSAEITPRIATFETFGPLAPGTTCVGHDAAALAAHHGLIAGPEAVTVDPATFARIAARRLGSPQPRPAPLYLRAADAAPSSDPRPVILDDA